MADYLTYNGIARAMASGSKSWSFVKMEGGISNSSKRQRIVEESEDRISSLPNRVLCHILSFLPTKYAVGTCILSTRWKYLWMSLPNLDFDDELFLHEGRVSRHSLRAIRVSFPQFVNRVLHLHNVLYLNRFHLRCGQNCDYTQSKAWIHAALCRNVQQLDLCISMTNSKFKVLPLGLFASGTLVVLKLGTKFVLDVPTSVKLPSLKTLHLNSIEFKDDDSVTKLISGCPVLEKLLIEDCGLKNVRVLHISAPALKCLIIECAFIGEYNTEFSRYKIVIDAQTLEYLRLIDYVAEGYSVKNLRSLIEAHVHVDISGRKLEGKTIAYSKNVLDLIRGISNVQVLHLSGDSVEALMTYICEVPIFRNVTHLELDANKRVEWKLLLDMLMSFPNLRALHFRQGLYHVRDILQWSAPLQAPRCLQFKLKIVKLLVFKGSEDELKSVEYLLSNAKVLKKLMICAQMTKPEELKITKELLMFTRRSKTCQVVFF